MSAENPAGSDTPTARRSQRNASSSASTQAPTPPVQVLPLHQESSTAVDSAVSMSLSRVAATHLDAGSDSDLTDLPSSEDDDAADNKSPTSLVPLVPSPKRRSPPRRKRLVKTSNKDGKELLASSSGEGIKRPSKVIQSDDESEEAHHSEAEGGDRKKRTAGKRSPPKDEGGNATVKRRTGNQREKPLSGKSRPTRDNYKREDRTSTLIIKKNEDGKLVGTTKTDEGGSKPSRIKLTVRRDSLHTPDEGGVTESETSTARKEPRPAKSGRAKHQQEQQPSSRVLSDSKEDLRDSSSQPMGRDSETKMAKRKATDPRRDDDNLRDHDRHRPAEKEEDRDREGSGRPLKQIKRSGDDDAQDTTHSDRDARRTKMAKSVRLENKEPAQRAGDHAHASLAANHVPDESFDKQYGHTSQDRIAKTPNTTHPSETERDEKLHREDVHGKRGNVTIRDEKSQDMDVDGDVEKGSSIAESRSVERKLTRDDSVEKVKDLSQPNKRKKERREEEDDSDRERESRKEAKPSQEKLEKLDQRLQKKKARTALPNDNVVDVKPEIDVILTDGRKRPTDKTSSLKKGDIEMDSPDITDSSVPISKPKLQKRPGGGEKTLKRVADLAGTGSTTPAEGKAKPVGDTTPVSQRRPGQHAAPKKSHYDPLGSALSSLPGIGPGPSSGNTTPINRKPVLKFEAVFLAAERDAMQKKREALYDSQVQLNSMSSGLLMQEYEDRPKPWRIRGNIPRDDVTGKNTKAVVDAILDMRNGGLFKNQN
ncbi:hypothetical protein QFC19_004961 [Naganishia cerealis]|uniref:Uncharacterized protein n=1 Tax=Naganishia cerealis TaxID=610337 RepID=A0ACC2VSD8_9TREE|nr:hypothetical protein QFC19_004961 [Naganishia cerealis]